MTPEGKVKQELRKVLAKFNAWHYMPVQNGMGRVGIPDLIACVPVTITPSMVGKTIGVFAGIEAKASGKSKNTTPNQKAVLKEIASASGVAVVADNGELADLVLKRLTADGITTYFIP